MFWRENGGGAGSSREQMEGGPPSGQVRVLVVGDAGVGKTSLVHLILNGSISRPAQTIGCSVSVKHITYGSSGSTSTSTSGDADRSFFVELWDISGHERYKDCRSIFYAQINGIIFVYDLSQRKTKSNLQKWANEVTAIGTFSAPLGSGGPGGIPVPYLVIANKADISSRNGKRASSGNLVDIARQWVEKQGLLQPTEELPSMNSFPGDSVLHAAAKEGRYDKEAIMKFFRMLIRRRYFSNELPSPWSTAPTQHMVHLDDNSIENDKVPSRSSFGIESYKYNLTSPLPTQRNLASPPGLYPQQQISMECYTYNPYSSSDYSSPLSSLLDKTSRRSSRENLI